MKDSPVSEDKNKNIQNPKPENTRIFKGLCTNCDHRFTCTLPRPESGVWYCEEYE